MNLKRAFDKVGSGVAILALSPVFLATAAACALHFRTSPIFKTERLGKDGTPFTMYKFRSMTEECGPGGELLPDEDRSTNFGRILRFSSIDELPQLINIWKGEMSFVGPRPYDTERYAGAHTIPEEYRGILKVRPGLTGPWQMAVIGRKTQMPMRERLELDLSYAESGPGFFGDLKMILGSLPALFRGHDGQHVKRGVKARQALKPRAP